jgi:hypothetical protein
MSYLRYNIDLAFKQPISSEVQAILTSFNAELKKLKPFAEKINADGMNEEDTERAKMHICKHDEGFPCEAEKEINIISHNRII